MRVLGSLLALSACSTEPRQPAPDPAPPPVTPSTDSLLVVDARAPIGVDAAPTDPLAELRARGLGDAAHVIEQRRIQRTSKMKLSAADARAAALAVLAASDRPPMRELHAVMPKSVVELARAVAERGVSVEEADAIAIYLVRVVGALAFERLGVFDENHSHVTGRDWHEIDYSGEGMTWQQQKADWTPRGVIDFKRARHIHAYFVGAEKLPHWARVYRPRGRMASVEPPPAAASKP